MAGTLTINFSANRPIPGDSIFIRFDTGSGEVVLHEKWVNVRSNPRQVTTPIGESTQTHIEYFVKAWNLDHADTGGDRNLLALQGDSEVTIGIRNPVWQFVSVTGSLVDEGKITFEIVNEPPVELKMFRLDGFTSGDCHSATAGFSAAGSPKYKVYVDGQLVLNNISSPFELPLERGSTKNVRLTGMDGDLIGSLVVRPPRKLIPEDIKLSVSNLPSGASVAVNVDFVHGDILPLTYSIGNDFQESNLFSALAEGTYTLKVKDLWGCETQKAFSVDGITELTKTVFEISDVNALRFARMEGGKKNFGNTLSGGSLKKLNYPFVHRYPTGELVRTQFKTNARNINVYAMDLSGNTEPLSVIKQSENIGLEAKSTCTHFDLGGGRSGIYFGRVDLLNPLTDEVTESTDYGFTLPSFANTEGQLVALSGIGQAVVDKVGYSDLYDSFILELNVAYTGVPVERTLHSVYSLQPYEVYEFDVPMVFDEFHVVVEAGMDAPEYTYVSEKIKKSQDSDKLYEIRYWDSKNKGGMVYGTGIRHKLFLEGYSTYIGEQETSGYNGDTGYYVTDNQIYRSENFVFVRISEEIAHKLRLVMAHEHLYINNVLYKLAEAPEINSDFINNQRTFSVVLKSGGDSFLEEGEEIISGSATEAVISGAMEASRGRSLLLWTKQNG